MSTRILAAHAEPLGGVWRGDLPQYEQVGPEPDGATVGLVGHGAIGSRVARMLHGFGAHVVVLNPTYRPGRWPGSASRCRSTICCAGYGWCRCTPGSPRKPGA